MKFGGHKLAAGLSLAEKDLEAFRFYLNRTTTLSDEDLIPKVSIDMQLPFVYVSEELVEALSMLEPFGKANTKRVCVEKDLDILNTKIVGKNQNVLKMQLRDAQGSVMDAVYFGDVQKFIAYYEEKPDKKAMFTYYPEINDFQGRRSLQIVIQNYM